MLISTRSRYGLNLMYELALKYGAAPVFLWEIAQTHGISEKYLSKLVIPLRGVGLVTSFRGAHGGYTLARDPRDITVREIVQVLEGDIVPPTRPPRSRGSALAAESPTEGVWALLEKTIAVTLEAVSLDSLVQAARQQALNYQI
jgi:Rrf2 family transcriptional regulator, cysteine metabolism repressor